MKNNLIFVVLISNLLYLNYNFAIFEQISLTFQYRVRE